MTPPETAPHQTLNRPLLFGSGKSSGVCWLRAYHTHLGTLMVFTELRTNPGLSVTNGAEHLVEECRRLGVNPQEAILLEHYGPLAYGPNEPHRFSRIRPSDQGGVAWEHFPTSAVVSLLGEAFLAEQPA